MAAALVQHAVATGTSTSPAVSFSGATTSGNLLLFKVAWQSGGGTLTPPSGFTTDVSKLVASVPQVAICSKANAASGTTFTASLSGSARWIAAVEEWSGLTTSSALDQTASAQTAAPSAGASGTTSATAQAAEMAAVAIACNDGSNGDGEFSSPTNSFTLLENATNGNPLGLATLYKILSATGAQSTAVSCSTSPDSYGVIATYKANTVSIDKGFDFRATAGFVTDNAPNIFAGANTSTYNYTVGNGYGWTTAAGNADTRDRLNSLDPRLAGMVFVTNSTTNFGTYRVDVPSSGSYDITLALHDHSGGGSNIFAEVLDSDASTVLFTVGPVTPSPTSSNVFDANGSQWSEAAWAGSNTIKTVTLSGTAVYLRLGKTATAGTTTLSHFRVATHAVPGSFTAAPTTVPSSHAGNITLTLTGTGTSWAGGGSQFTVSGVTGAAKNSENVTSTTAATLVVQTGSGTGTLTISDGTSSTTVTVGAPSFTLSPSTAVVGNSQSVTATGTNTVWTQETAASLFTKTGGTGASIASISVATNTSATFTLTNGSAVGNLTITDVPTGDTALFAVTATPCPIVFLGDSLTNGYGVTGYDGVASHGDTSPITTGTSQTYPARVMEALGPGWTGYDAGSNGSTFTDMNSRFASAVQAHYNSSAAANVCVICGDSDLAGTGTAGATILASLTTLLATSRAGGWTTIFVAIPPLGGTNNTNNNTDRGYVNSYVSTHWRAMGFSNYVPATANGGDVRIGGDTGSTTNTTYYQSDQTHWTATTTQLVADNVVQAVLSTQNAGGPGLGVRQISFNGGF